MIKNNCNNVNIYKYYLFSFKIYILPSNFKIWEAVSSMVSFKFLNLKPNNFLLFLLSRVAPRVLWVAPEPGFPTGILPFRTGKSSLRISRTSCIVNLASDTISL
ncbi:hypothetical protein WN66_05652 [Saccharomyces cerevisiae]|nr:hypothetical protein WN66_05652 [Saccharomyces cerevisiae]